MLVCLFLKGNLIRDRRGKQPLLLLHHFKLAGGMKGISECVSKLIRPSGKRRLDETSLPCRRFSLAEIKTATNNFDDNLFIGEWNYRKVYKGFIDDPTISVAIKCVNTKTMPGSDWLRNEVLLLCQLHHPNLLRLIGYCIEDKLQEFLVYEFMVNGNLGNHLYGTNHHEPLPWKQRLKICIGVARGLHYLHTGVKHSIIHRNVKTQKILLGEKLEPKLSDFGLSKKGAPSLSKALIRLESRVVGTLVYLDPEYCMSGELTDKSDVYSFGAVLLEVLCARKAYGKKSEVEEPIHLIRWAQSCKREGAINEIIDPYLMGKITPECFKVYIDIATTCVRRGAKHRPNIGEVQAGLEHALEIQESADAAIKDVDPTGDYNYPIDEYICNDSPDDTSSMEMGWNSFREERLEFTEELSLDTAVPSGQI